LMSRFRKSQWCPAFLEARVSAACSIVPCILDNFTSIYLRVLWEAVVYADKELGKGATDPAR
jgi:hypothetical protein